MNPRTEAWETAYRHGAFAASPVARNRYGEDRPETAVREHGTDQYLLVGAGLGTFAWRRPELANRSTVVELAHPASQEFKRDRLAVADMSVPDSLHFVSVDLESESVASALADTAYTTDHPAFYSWLDVIPYARESDEGAFFTHSNTSLACSSGGKMG